MPSGTVLSLHRWPVKSMGGEDAEALEVFKHGVRGDRQRALYWRGGRRLTARAAPRMLAWKAAANGGGPPLVTDPSGQQWHWDNPRLEEAISDDLKREVKLAEDPGLMQDLPDSLLITFEATHRGLERELGAGVDLRRFRTNVHVAMDVPPFSEVGWEGKRLRIGDAELDLLHPCLRCAIVTRDPDTQKAAPQILRHLHDEHYSTFGINARPRNEATIRVGDPVEIA